MTPDTRHYVSSGLGIPDFAVATKRDSGESVVTVSGEVDVETAPRLRKALISAGALPSPRVVVDLREVTFLDSTGLGVLVAGLKRARENGGDLRLVATSSHILRMLAITRLDSVFAVFPEVSAARS
jgi:anti-sigma B factor antagonist